MDPFTLALALVVVFVLFLMLTSGHRKQRLEQALKDLETDRMRLMKTIQHIKLSFYKRQLTEEEAQSKIFEFEEKLRDTESKILQIREKPLMRTLDKQQDAEKEEEPEIAKEEVEVAKSERVLLSNLDAKVIVVLFVVVILIIAAAMVIFNKAPSSSGVQSNSPPFASIILPVTATAVPELGTFPGGSGGMRINLENTYTQDLKDVSVKAYAPEGSGIHFDAGELAVKIIPEFEKGGTRELFIPVYVDKTTDEGEYQLKVVVSSADGSVSGTGSAKLIVTIGRVSPNTSP